MSETSWGLSTPRLAAIQKIGKIGMTSAGACRPSLDDFNCLNELAVKTTPINPGPMNHVALSSEDPEESAVFYRDVLGFEVTPRPAFSFRGAWLWHRDVGVMVHLIHDEHFHRSTSSSINTRTGHFAMHTSDYDAAVDHLRNREIEFVERVLPDYGYRQVFFRDPDGNIIELGEWPSPEEMLGKGR